MYPSLENSTTGIAIISTIHFLRFLVESYYTDSIAHFILLLFVGFTGIDQAYEAPENPDLSLTTVSRSIKDTMNEVITLLENNGIIPRHSINIY